MRAGAACLIPKFPPRRNRLATARKFPNLIRKKEIDERAEIFAQSNRRIRFGGNETTTPSLREIPLRDFREGGVLFFL
jgi:hypothetical protein